MSVGTEGSLPETRFTTDLLEEKERYPIWRDSISVLFDVDLNRNQDNERPFGASVHSWLMGPMMLATCRTRGHEWSRSVAQHMRDGIDHYLVQLYEEGHCSVLDGQGTVNPGDILIVDAAQNFESVTDDFQNLSLIVPRSLLSPYLTAPDEHQANVISSQTGLGGLLADHLRSLRQHASNMSSDDAAALLEPSLMLAAQAMNGSLSDNPEMKAVVRKSALNRIRDYIDDQLDDPELGPPRICKDFGLSRSQLYRMFEPIGGVSSYIRDRRLWRAMSDLVRPDNRYQRVADVAYKWGFSSESDFSRAFKRLFGFSPSEARAEDVGAVPLKSERTIESMNIERDYEHWLRSLA